MTPPAAKSSGQAILIVIGENLNREAIEGYWGRSRP